MTNTKSTKRALLTSAMALFLCFAMLLGTTYAWFTDSVTSANNIITSGNLDVELEYYDGDSWEKVTTETNVFKDSLWEPGYTEVVYLRVSNLGSLALKYQLGVNIASETPGINVAGDVFYLSDYIEYGVDKEVAVDANQKPSYADRAAAIAAATKAGVTKLNVAYSNSSKLKAKTDTTGTLPSEEYVALVVYMPETVGNEANCKTGTNPPVINLGINLFATQYTYERDSFGTDFDKDAPWTGEVDTTWYNTTDKEFTLTTAEQLAGLAELVNTKVDTFAGKTVKLGADMDLRNVNWTPIGTVSAKGEKAFTRTFAGTFIGTGYTISNLKVVGGNALGLFGRTGTAAHIEGVTINGAYVSGTDYVGAVAGYAYLAANCIKNCTVTNATIIATPYQMANGEYDGGAKAGVIVGYALNGNLIGNTVKASTVTAYRDLGAIAGMLNDDGIGERTLVASGNSVDTVELSYVGVAGKYADNKPNQNMGEVVGRLSSKSSVADDNTVTNVEKNETNEGVTMIYTLAELIAFAADVNAGNTYAGKTVRLGANIDLANMEWTPIGAGDKAFQGIFDGNGHTISNLKITGKNNNAGLFGNTNSGEIKNLTVENASVSGDLWVGVVAGTPYTSKYTNITVKGHVEVNGFSYVGGVGGKNAYADWTNITVDVDDGSYVKAISTENDIHYRTYVGGVVGFNGEGGHTFKNITSNINVIGDVCDIGGVFGIAHYGNNFVNITCTGNVTGTFFDPEYPEDADEIGGIAGVWYDQDGYSVTFTDCKFTGKLTAADASVDISNNNIVGKAYNANGKGELIIRNYSVTEDGLELCTDGVTGEVTLYLVPAAYTGTTMNVPEGVDTIGNFAFAYNNNVKTVVLPSTVTDLGRGFDSSTVEKVVLNEGLTTISSRAFKATTALKEVVIPSTVTTIADDAFQKTGLATITIPKNVEYIGVQAFGASQIENVIIEGDVTINNKAFRGCSKLKTFTVNGENIEFINVNSGSGNCWICNSESNNSGTSKITFNVKNPVVRAKILAAMGADITTITINCDIEVDEETGFWTDDEGNTCAYASTDTALDSSIKGGATTIYLNSGTYIIPDSAKGKTLTIVGSDDTVVASQDDGAAEGDCDYSFEGSTVTFENVTITTSTTYFPGYARMKGIYNNCTINGVYTLYDNSIFNNCTFNVSGDLYNVWTWGAAEATFNGCTFNCDGKAILLYGGANTKLTVNNCVFNDNGDNTVTDKAAIEVGSGYGSKFQLIVNNATVNGFAINPNGINTGTTLWANKNSMSGKDLKVIVDGKIFVSDGLYTDESGNWYIYNANGLMAFRGTIGTWGSDALANKSINIMKNIDATGKTWETAVIASGSASRNGFTFNGNGHTISNLTIVKHSDNATPGTGLFAMNAGNNIPTTFKDITFDNVTVNGDVHTGVLWGQMYGKLIVEGVSVINSNVTGTANVGALVGRNGDDSASEITFKNCSVKNTKIEATGTTRTDDKAGASAFLGMALTVEVNNVGVTLVFEGTNVSEGNMLITADGYQGGGIYTTSAWDTESWTAPVIVNDFTNYNSNN